MLRPSTLTLLDPHNSQTTAPADDPRNYRQEIERRAWALLEVAAAERSAADRLDQATGSTAAAAAVELFSKGFRAAGAARAREAARLDLRWLPLALHLAYYQDVRHLYAAIWKAVEDVVRGCGGHLASPVAGAEDLVSSADEALFALCVPACDYEAILGAVSC